MKEARRKYFSHHWHHWCYARREKYVDEYTRESTRIYLRRINHRWTQCSFWCCSSQGSWHWSLEPYDPRHIWIIRNPFPRSRKSQSWIYLELLSKVSVSQSAIWHEAMRHDTSGMIRVFIELSGIISSPFTFNLDWRKEKIRENCKTRNTNTIEIKNLSWFKEEELTLIENELQKWPLLLLVNNRKQSEWMYSILSEKWYSIEEYFESTRFCSIEMIHAWLKKGTWSRKETILMIKILTWLWETKTGLLDELKFYGEEREYIDIFRSEKTEWNIFREEKRKKIDQSKIIIAEMWITDLGEKNVLENEHTLMIRDCILFWDILRKKESYHISFEKIHSLSSFLRGKYNDKCWQDIDFSIALIQEIFETTPLRPQGNSAFPPGDFGETYFFTQDSLWNNGNKWLVLASYSLQNSIEKITILLKDAGIIERKYSEELLWKIEKLIEITRKYDSNTGIILQISESDTIVISVPRSIKNNIEKIITIQWNGKVIFSGCGISGTIIQKFIKNEYGLSFSIDRKWEESTINIQNKLTIKEKKTVILSTNMKHLRQITQDIKWTQEIKNILTQWLSWWKWKILSLFQNSNEKSVLIGLLDSYIDESFLWERIDEVFIAKMPFDPPTDAYFLARTVGMKNNFEEYSMPMALSGIESLIIKILLANENIFLMIGSRRCFGERNSKKNSSNLYIQKIEYFIFKQKVFFIFARWEKIVYALV